MQLTELETKALAALRANVEHIKTKGEVKWGEVYIDNALAASKMNKRSWSGVLASLSKKNLYRPDGGDFKSEFGDVVLAS